MTTGPASGRDEALPTLRARRGMDCAAADVIESDIPGRLDRLPWSRFHSLVVFALGITWILDGLEVTVVGSLSGAIAERSSLALTDSQIGLAASGYLAGAVLGAMVFGYLTDRLGRKRLFTVTVGIYVAATIATGLSWNFLSFAAFRFATGAGIGGEYAAINSAIQELVPARYRGRTDLAINGSFWLGAAIGAEGSVLALHSSALPPEIAWRLVFAIGGMLGLVVMVLRRYVPESPRWLLTHARASEAERIVAWIEARIRRRIPAGLAASAAAPMRLRPRGDFGFFAILRAIFARYPKRALLGLFLISSQAFFYNAIFFTYALVLTRFYAVPFGDVGNHILWFSLGNFAGPLVLGRFFDTIGRKIMITATYGCAAILMAATAILFARGLLDAQLQTLAWSVIFFAASAAASAAYLTVSENFPLEARALAIALFYALGTALGGLAGPAIFGALIDTGARDNIALGYLFGALLMLVAAVAETVLGVAAERQPLETVAPPLSQVD